MSESILPLLTAALSAGLGFLAAWFWVARAARVTAAGTAAKEMEAMRKRLVDLETDNALLKKDVQPLSVAMQSWLVDKLTHFHTPVMDALLVKLGPPNILTDEEEKELAAALLEREIAVDDKISPEERDAARMLPMVIRWVKAEAQKAPESPALQIVSTMPEPAEKPKPEGDEEP